LPLGRARAPCLGRSHEHVDVLSTNPMTPNLCRPHSCPNWLGAADLDPTSQGTAHQMIMTFRFGVGGRSPVVRWHALEGLFKEAVGSNPGGTTVFRNWSRIHPGKAGPVSEVHYPSCSNTTLSRHQRTQCVNTTKSGTLCSQGTRHCTVVLLHLAPQAGSVPWQSSPTHVTRVAGRLQKSHAFHPNRSSWVKSLCPRPPR